MTQRLLSSRLLASTALLLGGGGLIGGIACGSDERPPVMGENPLNPGSGAPNGVGGSSTTPLGETPSGGTAPVSSGGSEGQQPDVPLEPSAENPDGTPGDGPAPTEPPPATLAPNCEPPAGAPPALALELVAEGLNEPLFVSGAPGDDTRLFVVEKGGAVRVLVNGELQQQPFIDIGANVQNAGERGLLGLAFHPDYAENGLFYLHFSSQQNDGDGLIAEFSVNANNRSLANPATRRDILLFANDPAGNHNGGDITFGADGFLYIGMGDGGGRDDEFGPIGNGQNLQTLLGKLLRIDVNGRDVNNAYSIPPNNLAAQTGETALPEIWAYGLRNPWRFSFDPCTQDLYIGDVGQDAVEEIDFLPADAPAGANFGWRLMEGPACRPGDTVCPGADRSNLILPIDSYDHTVGISVTGGYVYRGSAVPGLRGHYIYADFRSSRFFTFRVDGGQLADRRDVSEQLRPAGIDPNDFEEIASFGRDNAGEVYVTAFQPSGAVYRIVAAP